MMLTVATDPARSKCACRSLSRVSKGRFPTKSLVDIVTPGSLQGTAPRTRGATDGRLPERICSAFVGTQEDSRDSIAADAGKRRGRSFRKQDIADRALRPRLSHDEVAPGGAGPGAYFDADRLA